MNVVSPIFLRRLTYEGLVYPGLPHGDHLQRIVRPVMRGGIVMGNWPEIDLALNSGAFCGALIFVLRSKEPSTFKRALYFFVSLIGGHAMTPFLQELVPSLPVWPAAFVSSAIVVSLSIVALDWSEVAVPQILNSLVDRFFGGNRRE